MVENDGMFLGMQTMAVLADTYVTSEQNHSGDKSAEDKDEQNPLAWPLYADKELLTGLPPMAISVNELDPLRDEGLAFYANLIKAGNAAYARTVHGTVHAGDCLFGKACPEIFDCTIRDIKSFADKCKN
jgi:acetyl esterase/lipase